MVLPDWKVTKCGRSFSHGWLMMLLVLHNSQILQGKRLLIPRRWFFRRAKRCSLGVAWSVALCAYAEDKVPWFWAALVWLSPRELPSLVFGRLMVLALYPLLSKGSKIWHQFSLLIFKVSCPQIPLCTFPWPERHRFQVPSPQVVSGSQLLTQPFTPAPHPITKH